MEGTKINNLEINFVKSKESLSETSVRFRNMRSSFECLKQTNSAPIFYKLSQSNIIDQFTGEQNHAPNKDEEIIFLPKLDKIETKLLNLVAADDLAGVQEYLKQNPNININCSNYRGETALMFAVKNGSEKMVTYLLSLPNIDISDNALLAVRLNNMNLTRNRLLRNYYEATSVLRSLYCSLKKIAILLDALKKISPGLEFAGSTHSLEFASHVTPMIVATHNCLYEMTNMLLCRGHKIYQPHPLCCSCVKCKQCLLDDPLHVSSARLMVYRAVTSPVYLVHQAADQILAAFLLSAELLDNALAQVHLAADYIQLRDIVSEYAVDLIGCCRTSNEVELILKQTSGYMGRRQFELPRLLMAVDLKQKEFVAHPNTQQVLETHWRKEWYSWNNKPFIYKALTILSRIVITPAILLMCIVYPRSKLVKYWRIPLNKLITHASAYFVFLGLVFHISNQDRSKQIRGPPNTGAEAPLILCVCGYTWSAVRMCLMQGPRRYFSKMWNWAELIMLTLFGLTFIFWVLAAVDVIDNKEDEFVERRFWNQYDSTLLAEGTFCLATIFAYFRLMQFCQLNYQLGPLQVSLGKMTLDIYKYIIVFTIVISAFAVGLARFYQYYDGMVYEDEFGMKTVQVSSFTSLSDTLKTLFWALFCMSPLESADVVLANTRDSSGRHDNRHGYTERIGYFCFGCFEVISVIVVLNMLIATMSNTFQRVNDNVAIEWTFGRTEVYVDYMWQTTLPSPYNMVPTAAAMSSVLEWFRTTICSEHGIVARWSPFYCCYIERDLEASLQKEYPALMSVLLQRYFKRKPFPECSTIESKKSIYRKYEKLHYYY